MCLVFLASGLYRPPTVADIYFSTLTGNTIQMHGTYETWLDQPKKSVVAERSINTGHQIDFSNISVLDRASEYMDRLVKEAIQIRLSHKNFNRDNVFTLSQAWNPVTKLLFKHDTDPGKAAIEPAH
jgi:flagella basal body P-ring formation protein FlgA